MSEKVKPAKQQQQQKPPKQKQQQQQQKGGGKGGDKGQQGQKKKPQKPANDGAEDVKREQKLQAILLADSFSKSFRPTTIECPKVLLPLVNVPMLEYTLEFLAQNGVEEIFVFCVWHAEAVEKYVNESKWPSILSVRCITSAKCLSAGDALRELDALNVIRSDPFILISGDVISNVNLKDAIAFHKQKRKEDMNNVMTVVLKRVQQTAGAKRIQDDLVVAMNRKTSQIVLFDDNLHKKSLRISLELMAEHPQGIVFQRDLLDCNVDICSPELMLQFSDNFDYQDIRRHFIRNEVGNWELGKHIYGYLIQNEYAARVMDFRSYHSICRDIVTRWVFPLVPDAQLLQDSTYTHTKRYTYREQGVRVAREAQVCEGVVLSRGTVVEEGALIRRSIVGRDCFIGNGAHVIESHIWGGASIGANCRIDKAIVCNGAVVGEGAVVPRGCVLSYGVVVGPGAVLPEYCHISKCADDRPEGMRESALELGEGGLGYLWKAPEGEDDEEGDADEIEELADNEVADHRYPLDPVRVGSIGCVEEEQWKSNVWRAMPVPEEEEESDEDTASYGGSGIMMSGADSNNNFDLDDGFGDIAEENGELQQLLEELIPSSGQLQFAGLVGEMVGTGHSDSNSADDLLMDIKGLKFAKNKTFCDCLCGIVPALLTIVYKESNPDHAASTNFNKIQFLAQLRAIMKTEEGWGYIMLRTLIQDTKEELEILRSIEDTVLLPEFRSNLRPIFHYIIQVLYNADILTEDGLQCWIEQRQRLQSFEGLPSKVASPGCGAEAGVMLASANVCCIPAGAQERMDLFLDADVQKFVEEFQDDSEEEEEDSEEEVEEEEDGAEVEEDEDDDEGEE